MLGSSHAPCGLKDTTTQTHDSCYPKLHIAYTVAIWTTILIVSVILLLRKKKKKKQIIFNNLASLVKYLQHKHQEKLCSGAV